MDDWRRAVAQYQQGVQSVAQSNLQEKEALLQGKASLISGQTGQLEEMTGGKFADKLAAEGKKFAGDLGFDLSAGATFPTILRGASRLAQMRSAALTSRWKTTQAQRFNEQEQARGQQAEDAEPVETEPGPTETIFSGQSARGPVPTNVRATYSQNADDGQAVPDDNYVASAPENVRTGAATGNLDDPIQMDDIGDVNEMPSFVDAFDTPFTDSLPTYARGVGRMGAALRGYARGGYSGSATSDNIGDAINQARGGNPPEPEAPSGKPKFTTAEDDEFGDEPLGAEEFGLRGDVRPIGQTEIGGRGPQALNLEERTPLQETEPATGGEPQVELPKITVQDIDPDVQPDVSRAENLASQTAEEAENVGETAVEDLAPELTSAASAWSSVAGFLGDAIPIIGFGVGLYGLISGAEDISQSIKDENTNPYASIMPKIKAAQNQISGLEANVSADEFASKIGARAPQFGSIAAAPNLDTAKQQGIALHA